MPAMQLELQTLVTDHQKID